MTPRASGGRAVSRRRILFAAPSLLAAAGLPQAHAAEGAQLPAAASLAGELAAALARGRALIVMVSLEGCPFCRIVRNNYLAPLRAEGQPVVQVELKRDVPLLDFARAATTHGRFVEALGVKLAPTVLFFGRGGKEVAPRLAGTTIPDFYGAYLQDRVDAANRAVAS